MGPWEEAARLDRHIRRLRAATRRRAVRATGRAATEPHVVVAILRVAVVLVVGLGARISRITNQPSERWPPSTAAAAALRQAA